MATELTTRERQDRFELLHAALELLTSSTNFFELVHRKLRDCDLPPSDEAKLFDRLGLAEFPGFLQAFEAALGCRQCERKGESRGGVRP
jgi:hypothetical protein